MITWSYYLLNTKSLCQHDLDLLFLVCSNVPWFVSCDLISHFHFCMDGKCSYLLMGEEKEFIASNLVGDFELVIGEKD